MPISIALDILLAVLLTFTIGYAVILNRRLISLRRDRKKLENFAKNFSKATMRAEESINQLKGSADDLSKHITMAQTLRDDLSFLIDRGGSEADRLEEKVRLLRHNSTTGKVGQTARGSSSATTSVPQGAEHLKSEAERDLLRALESVR